MPERGVHGGRRDRQHNQHRHGDEHDDQHGDQYRNSDSHEHGRRRCWDDKRCNRRRMLAELA